MALANFFGKNALAAGQVLNGITPAAFAERLSSHTVGIAVDAAAAASAEGTATALLATDLAARLYPRIALVGLGAGAPELTAQLRNRALAINPDIDFAEDPSRVTAVVVIGDSEFHETDAQAVYAGSYGWTVRFSPSAPVGSGRTRNPFGAGAAACFAMANVFRIIFGDRLPDGQVDPAFSMSLLNQERTSDPIQYPGPDLDHTAVDLGETFLAGVGAVGNGVVWALSRVPRLHGTLRLVDSERIELSNLQRYVLATQEHSAGGMLKVNLAADTMRRGRRPDELAVIGHPMRWDEFLGARDDWRLERVATAFDTIQDRLAVQAALPRRLLNAWTQNGDLGVSRHLAFGTAPCLACLYRQKAGGKSDAERIGEELGFPGAPPFIRELLVTNAPIDEGLVREIARRKGISSPDSVEVLRRFVGQPLRVFHSNVICGGALIHLGDEADATSIAEVPIAFQSALAGILLGAEIVIDAAPLRSEATRDCPPVRTVIDLLRPLAQFVNQLAGRSSDGHCLCADPDRLRVYREKYGPA